MRADGAEEDSRVHVDSEGRICLDNGPYGGSGTPLVDHPQPSKTQTKQTMLLKEMR